MKLLKSRYQDIYSTWELKVIKLGWTKANTTEAHRGIKQPQNPIGRIYRGLCTCRKYKNRDIIEYWSPWRFQWSYRQHGERQFIDEWLHVRRRVPQQQWETNTKCTPCWHCKRISFAEMCCTNNCFFIIICFVALISFTIEKTIWVYGNYLFSKSKKKHWIF